MLPYLMKTAAIPLCLLLGTISAQALYLGPPAVYESTSEQAANLATSKQKLVNLQRAARECTTMRLQVVQSNHARLSRPVDIPLTDYDRQQLRRIIARMKAVKETGSAPPDHVTRLQLLNAAGRELAHVDFHEVVSDTMVSSQGYATGARLSLAPAEATAWYWLMKADQSRTIARQPMPAKSRRRLTEYERNVERDYRHRPDPGAVIVTYEPDELHPLHHHHRHHRHHHGKHDKHHHKHHGKTEHKEQQKKP